MASLEISTLMYGVLSSGKAAIWDAYYNATVIYNSKILNEIYCEMQNRNYLAWRFENHKNLILNSLVIHSKCKIDGPTTNFQFWE